MPALMVSRRRLIAVLVPPLLLLGSGYAAHDYIESAAFVVRAAKMQGLPRRLAAIEAEAVTAEGATIRWRGGELRGRTYVPADVSGRAILLVPGVHAGGMLEPRLVAFAREIAATGHPVITAELPDLAEYTITPRTTDMIEDAARWTAAAWRDRLPASDRAVGLAGISFGGGLAAVAASRMKDEAAWVLSFGGHGDLPRTLRYLCTGLQPDGTTRPPHDYGVVIILLGVADRLVPPSQVAPLRNAIRMFLSASHIDMLDKQQGAEAFARARQMGEALEQPARTLMSWVSDRDVARLGPALLPHVAALGGDPALSPEKNAPPSAAVYLLHGADDNVIPAAESSSLAAYLEGRGARVVQLATRLITHAEVDRPPRAGEVWQLIRFWSGPI